MKKSKNTEEIISLCRQYSKLVRSHKQAETNINKLHESKDYISKDNFNKYLTENKQTLEDTKPKLQEVETDLREKLKIYSEKKKKIEFKIEELENTIKEYERLFDIGVISKGEQKDSLVAIAGPLKDKIAELKQIKKMTAILADTIDKPENIYSEVTNESLKDKRESNHGEKNKGNFRAGIQELLERNALLAQILGKTTNYLQRFLVFIVLSQLLYLFSFIIIRLEIYFDIPFSAVGLTFLIFFVISIFLMIIFLFTETKAKAATYFGVGLTYLLVSVYFASIMGTFRWYEVGYLSFLGTWGFWNLTLSVIVLGIGIIRTFILGIGADYRQNAV